MNVSKRTITSDLKRLDMMKDEDIDYSDIPEADEEFFKNAKVYLPHKKVSINVRYDQDVVEYFKKGGRGYQTRMNAVLRAYMEHHRRHHRHKQIK